MPRSYRAAIRAVHAQRATGLALSPAAVRAVRQLLNVASVRLLGAAAAHMHARQRTELRVRDLTAALARLLGDSSELAAHAHFEAARAVAQWNHAARQ